MAQKWLRLTSVWKGTSHIFRSPRFGKVIMTKFLKVVRILNVMNLRKFKKPISYFQIEKPNFFHCGFCFFCVCCFSFALLTFSNHKTKMQQRTYINRASNINTIKTMASWQNQVWSHIQISEKLLNLKLSRSHAFHF